MTAAPDTLRGTVSTDDGRLALSPLPPAALRRAQAPGPRTLPVDPSATDQPLLGMGANLTDTDVYNILRMSRPRQDEVLEALFHPERGAGWNFLRLPLGSTDWESTHDFYTYDDCPAGERDWDLRRFSVQRDVDRGFFALVRRCLEINPDLLFLGSVWGVPGWMKDNRHILFGRFDPACAGAYAHYLRLAVQAFASQGIRLHALATQNEPLCGDDRATPACRFTWRMQRDVLVALRQELRAHGLDTEIWAYDHNFDLAHAFVDPLLADPEARAAVDGVAFHGYGGSPAEISRLRGLYPEMPFYMTERFLGHPGDLDHLVQQLRHGARSYLQWTAVTDEYGGPHQFLGRPFVYRKPRDPLHQTFIYNLRDEPDRWSKSPAYGLYAQFTKYLKRGMRRVDCSAGHPGWVTAVAFAGADGEIALVTVNQTDAEQAFSPRVGGAEAEAVQPARSVATWLIRPGPLALGAAFRVPDAPQEPRAEPAAWDLAPVEILFPEGQEEGAEVALACRVRNVGTLPTPDRATLSVQFSLDGDCPVARSAARVGPIPPGGEVVAQGNVPYGGKTAWTAEAGHHTLIAWVELGNCPAEANTGNNRLGRDIWVRPSGGPAP